MYLQSIACRYQIPRPDRNISSLVEELPQLPDIRAGHACSQLPLSGVRDKYFPTCCVPFALLWNTTNENPSTDKLRRTINYSQPISKMCRHSLWREGITAPSTLPPCWPSSLARTSGPLSPRFQDPCTEHELWLLEGGWGWPGEGMMEEHTEVRWGTHPCLGLLSIDPLILIITLFCLTKSGTGVLSESLEHLGQDWESPNWSSTSCCPGYWASACCLRGRWRIKLRTFFCQPLFVLREGSWTFGKFQTAYDPPPPSFLENYDANFL